MSWKETELLCWSESIGGKIVEFFQSLIEFLKGEFCLIPLTNCHLCLMAILYLTGRICQVLRDSRDVFIIFSRRVKFGALFSGTGMRNV